MSRRRRHCPVTGKTSFHDEAEAKRALTAVRQNAAPGDTKVPTRYYRCGHCRRWHLTSQALDPDRHRPPTDVVESPFPSTLTVDTDGDRQILEDIIRRCIATNCGTCMHDPQWGAYLIRRKLLPNQQPTTTEGEHHHD